VKQQKEKNNNNNNNYVPIKFAKYCKCFNATDKAFYDKQASNVCSYYYCKKRVVGPIPHFSFFSTQCTLGGGGARMHVIPTTYCSSKCQKRGLNFKIE